MDFELITTLVGSGESETLEFKATTGARREAARTVCAFLNQGGGQALFGVTSAGVVVGQQVSEHTIEELSAELRQRLPAGWEHDAGHVGRRVQPDALRTDAQRAALGEPARHWVVGRRPRRGGDSPDGLGGGPARAA